MAATPNALVSPRSLNLGLVQFLQGTDSPGTYKTLYTAGSNFDRVYGMWMTNNDPSATHLVTVQIVRGGIKYGGVALTTVENAGFASGTPPQVLLSAALWPGCALDPNGNAYLPLLTGDLFEATYGTNLTASTLINIGCIGAVF